MSFTGKELFIAENIDAEDLINQMNGNNNGYEGYLTALGNLFVGKAEEDPSRTKFSNATQKKRKLLLRMPPEFFYYSRRHFLMTQIQV